MNRIKIGGIIFLLSFLLLVPLALAGELTSKTEEPAVKAAEPAVNVEEPVVKEEPAAKAEEPAAKAEESAGKIASIRDTRPIYTVGIGDVLTIRLREGVKLTEYDATVMSTGTIVISFIEIEAAGHTIPEIREQAQKELGKYIRDFSVDLIPKEWREKKVIVLGEVEKPGVYNFSAGMTTVQAVALAGGFKNTAVLSDTRIVRGNLDHPELIQVDLHKTAKGKDTRDVLLAQNDVIYVPRSTIGDWNNFINLYIRPTVEVMSLPLSNAATIQTFGK
ncbi:MAG: polysaccharide export protein [Deltaproteobacteria bacterium]|nr:polysaccharide export protein [Deltaproteobacteria bacterium]